MYHCSESGTFVLKGFDDLQALLDDHVTVTQQMAFSAFKKPFAERIERSVRCFLLFSRLFCKRFTCFCAEQLVRDTEPCVGCVRRVDEGAAILAVSAAHI